MVPKIPSNSRSPWLLQKLEINGKKSHTASTMLYLFSKRPLFYAYSNAFSVLINNFK